MHYSCVASDPEDDNPARLIRLGPHFTTGLLPALKSLWLDHWDGGISTALGTERSPPHFPWTQLHHLHLSIGISDFESILYLLRTCSELTHFSVSRNSDEFLSLDRPVPDVEPVLHAQLVQLEMNLEGICEDDLSPLNMLPFLCTPKLQTFSIIEWDDLSETTMDQDLS